MARAALSWAGFAAQAPEFSAAGRRLLEAGIDGVPIGFLATVGASGEPHLSPVCPKLSSSSRPG